MKLYKLLKVSTIRVSRLLPLISGTQTAVRTPTTGGCTLCFSQLGYQGWPFMGSYFRYCFYVVTSQVVHVSYRTSLVALSSECNRTNWSMLNYLFLWYVPTYPIWGLSLSTSVSRLSLLNSVSLYHCYHILLSAEYQGILTLVLSSITLITPTTQWKWSRPG